MVEEELETFVKKKSYDSSSEEVVSLPSPETNSPTTTFSPSVTKTPTVLPTSKTPTTTLTLHPHTPNYNKNVNNMSANPELSICLKVPLKDSRQKDNTWDCNTKLNLDENIFKVYPMEEIPNQEIYLREDNPFSIHLIFGDSWGQLCNKMSIFAGWIGRLTRERKFKKNSILAFNTEFSDVAWILDFQKLTFSITGLLLDCNICGASGYIHCHHFILNNKIYKVAGHLFKVSSQIDRIELFYQERPRSRGRLLPLIHHIHPKPYLIDIIKILVQNMKSKLLKEDKIIGMHRRYMDNMCYIWIKRLNQFNCMPSKKLKDEIADIGVTVHSREDYYISSDYLRKMDETYLTMLESKHPLVIPCNYTLNELQLNLIKNSSWKGLTSSSKVSILLASDSQTPNGEAALYRSSIVRNISKITDGEKNTCFQNKKFHYMLAEMIALSLTDFHMGNVLSSCDDIVAHWRSAYGMAKGSSYPPICYDGFYL